MRIKLGNEKVQFSWVELSASARLSDSMSWQNMASRSIFSLTYLMCTATPELRYGSLTTAATITSIVFRR